MVLLDSEGIDRRGLEDGQIVTLTVLLASVFIYNSLSNPMSCDLVELEYPIPHVTLRWLITVSSIFQDVDFDGSLLPVFITSYYNHGIEKLPNHR